MKERFLWMGVIILIACWIGNYSYFQSQQISQPVFLDHYYAVTMEKELMLDFYYLTNKSDRSRINYVELEGVRAFPIDRFSGVTMLTNGQPIQYVREYRHQYLKKMTVQIPTDELDWSSGKPLVFEHMTAYFSGRKVQTKIGKIVIHPQKKYIQAFDFVMSGSSDQHRDEALLAVNETNTISDIIIPFADRIGDDVAVKVDEDQTELKEGTSDMHDDTKPDWISEELSRDWNKVPGVSSSDNTLYPIELEKGELLKLNIWSKPKRYSYYNFEVLLDGETKDGEFFTTPVMVNDQPSLDEKTIDEFIREKGGHSE